MSALDRYFRYHVHKNGIDKFPAYNQTQNFHKNGVQRYANIGNNHREPECKDLPRDGYPYSGEWSENRFVH